MNDRAAELERSEALVDALLYSVSHDLRSPLLAVSLSAELLEQGGEGAGEALRGLREGAAELERMLQALTVLTRARRREFTPRGRRLGALLAGHVVISEVADLASIEVVVDPEAVRALLAALGNGGPVEARIAAGPSEVQWDFAVPSTVPAFEGSPLLALSGGLQAFAGTPVEALAAAEVALTRTGGSVTREDARLIVRVRRAGS